MAENLEMMWEIDREYTEHPTKCVDGMVGHLSLLGFLVGRASGATSSITTTAAAIRASTIRYRW